VKFANLLKFFFIGALAFCLTACASSTLSPEALAAEQTRNAELLGTYQANQQVGASGQTDPGLPNSTSLPTNSAPLWGEFGESSTSSPLQTQGTAPVVATHSAEPNRTTTPTQTAAVTTPSRTAAVTTPTQPVAVNTPTRTATMTTPTRTAALPTPTRTAAVQTPTRTAALPTPTRTAAVQTPTQPVAVNTPTRTATVTTPTRTAVLPTQTPPSPGGWEGEWTVFLGQEGGPYTTGTLSVTVEGENLTGQAILAGVSYEFSGEINQYGQYVLGDYTQDTTAGWFYWTLLSDVQFGGTLDNNIGFCATKGGTQPPDPCVYYLIS